MAAGLREFIFSHEMRFKFFPGFAKILRCKIIIQYLFVIASYLVTRLRKDMHLHVFFFLCHDETNS